MIKNIHNRLSVLFTLRRMSSMYLSNFRPFEPRKIKPLGLSNELLRLDICDYCDMVLKCLQKLVPVVDCPFLGRMFVV